MPYFHFHADDVDNFDEKLKSFRCSYIKPNGQRCKKSVVMGLPLCFPHSLKTYNVKIQKSLIPNTNMKGLFAFDVSKGVNEIVFNKNDVICPYSSELINLIELNKRYGEYTAPYAVELSKEVYRDGAIERGIGSFINHAPQRKVNSRFSVNQRNKTVNIVATKRIRNNEEIYLNYGRQYMINERGVMTTTNNRKKRI